MSISNNWNIGSFIAEMGNLISDIPASLSGTGMNNIIYGAIEYVNDYTGLDLGSSGIEQKYHNAILYKSMVDVLHSKDLIGADVGTVSLSEFSTSKGNSNVSTAAIAYQALLKDELRFLGRKLSYYRSY